MIQRYMLCDTYNTNMLLENVAQPSYLMPKEHPLVLIIDNHKITM